MKGLRRFHVLSIPVFIVLCLPFVASAQQVKTEKPVLAPLRSPVPATAVDEGAGEKRSPGKARKVSPRLIEIRTCKPEVKEISPSGCLSPGGAVVTVRGSCFGEEPGPYGAAVRTGRGKVHRLDHGKWSDESVTLKLPPLSTLAPGADGLLGIADSSSRWIDGEPFTVCTTPSRKAAAPKATKQTLQAGKVPGATLKKSVADKSTESRVMTKAGPDPGKISSTPPQGGGGIGQKLYNDPPIPPGILVNNPSAGEYLTEGETHTITWEFQGLPAATCVNLWLYRGKPRHVLVRPNVCATTWDWNVPGVPYGIYWNIAVEAIGTNVIGHSGHFTVSRDVADPYIDNPRIVTAAPKTGETVTFKAQIRNLGGAAPVQNNATLVVTGPNGYHETYPYIFPLLQPGDPGSFFNVNQSYPVPAPGAYYNELSVEFIGGPYETLLPASATVAFYAEDMPDLVACLHDPWRVSTGVTKTVPIYVKNIGTAASEETMMAFYVQGKGIVHRTVPPLQPGESVQIPYQNKWWISGNRNMIASVDPNDIVDELFEDNNRRCATLKRQHGKVYNYTDFPSCSDTDPCTTPMPAGN